MKYDEPLHPETLRELRQMVKIHGAERLIKAIREMIFAQPKPASDEKETRK